MSKADNYNEYDYDQASAYGTKAIHHPRSEHEVWIRSLVTRSRSEVYLQSQDQGSNIKRLMKEDK